MAHEKPGRPGFHFHVLQPAKTGPTSYMRKNPSGFGGHFAKQRHYPVYFKINIAGEAVYLAGVAPTEATMEEARRMIAGMRNPRLLDIPCEECLVPDNCRAKGGCIWPNQNGEDTHGRRPAKVSRAVKRVRKP